MDCGGRRVSGGTWVVFSFFLFFFCFFSGQPSSNNNQLSNKAQRNGWRRGDAHRLALNGRLPPATHIKPAVPRIITHLPGSDRPLTAVGRNNGGAGFAARTRKRRGQLFFPAHEAPWPCPKSRTFNRIPSRCIFTLRVVEVAMDSQQPANRGRIREPRRSPAEAMGRIAFYLFLLLFFSRNRARRPARCDPCPAWVTFDQREHEPPPPETACRCSLRSIDWAAMYGMVARDASSRAFRQLEAGPMRSGVEQQARPEYF